MFSFIIKNMSYVLEAIKDKPLGIWPLGDASPFQDYSGYNRSGSTSGTAGSSIALVAGASASSVFDNTSYAEFEAPVFLQGRERNAFSLEAWFYVTTPDATTGPQQVLGHLGEDDGIMVDGTKISFSTKYLTAGEAKVEYDIQVPRAVQVVATHTSDKNSLYIDGILVGNVEITAEQMADDFIATDGVLSSGASASNRGLAMNGVAIYNYALSGEVVASHFRAGRRRVGTSVSAVFAGTPFLLSKGTNLIANRIWDSTEDWAAGYNFGLTVDNGDIIPQFVDGTSVPGRWLDSCDLYDAGIPSPINSINFQWDGEGVVIEASLDNQNWETVERGVNLSIIPEGFDPTEQELSVRVSFPGGIVGDESYLSSLTVNVFRSDTVVFSDTTSVTYAQPADIRSERDPAQLSDDWGVNLRGGSITLGLGTLAPKTVEIWYKGDLTTSLVGTTSYVNGVAGTSTATGEWRVAHLTTATAIADDIILDGDAQVGRVVTYEDELTAANIANIYTALTGVPRTRVGDNSVVAVAESPEASKIYAHDWSIESAY